MTRSTPHDALFKRTFGNVTHAVGELQALLPRALAQRIDWSSLEVEKSSFVDERLSARHSDLLYTVRAFGERVYIYLLFEHQSSEDPLMAFRLLVYMVRIWERWLTEQEGRGVQSLPAILPLVLFHGGERWRASQEFSDLIHLDGDIKEALLPHLPRFRFILDDLTQASHEELRTRSLTPEGFLALGLLRDLRRTHDLRGFIRVWAHVFSALASGDRDPSAFRSMLQYILEVREETPGEIEDMMEDVAGKPEAAAVRTAYDMLMQKGEQRGEQKGIQKGIQKGECRALVGSILKIMESRGIDVSPLVRAKVEACTEVPQLQLWFDEALEASDSSFLSH